MEPKDKKQYNNKRSNTAAVREFVVFFLYTFACKGSIEVNENNIIACIHSWHILMVLSNINAAKPNNNNNNNMKQQQRQTATMYTTLWEFDTHTGSILPIKQ